MGQALSATVCANPHCEGGVCTGPRKSDPHACRCTADAWAAALYTWKTIRDEAALIEDAVSYRAATQGIARAEAMIEGRKDQS